MARTARFRRGKAKAGSVLRRFQLFEKGFGLFGAALGEEGLAEEIDRFAVAGIENQGAAQDAFGIREIMLLEIALAKQDERAAEVRVEPDGALEIGNGQGPMLSADVSVAEAVPGGGIAGIEGDFLFEMGDGGVEVALGNGDFPEEEMRAGDMGVQRERFGRFDGSLVVILALEHHLGGGAVGGGGFRFQAEQARKGDLGFIRLRGLEVGVAEHVFGFIDVFELFKPWNCLGGLAEHEKALPDEEGGLAKLRRAGGFGLGGLLEGGDGGGVILLFVKIQAALMASAGGEPKGGEKLQHDPSVQQERDGGRDTK